MMASPDEDLSYLQPDFDPASYTVANLRKALFTHDIKYSSSAKKSELVAIFNSDLKPQAKKILAKHQKIQRSSRGIEDAASSIASTQEDDLEEEAIAQPPVKRGRGRPKKSAAPTEAESEDETLIAPATTTSRRRTPIPNKSKEQEEPRQHSQSRARQSRRGTTATPGPQKETSVPETWKKYGDDSPFSAENPFQSGSSPPPPPVTSSKRRQTDGVQPTKPRKSEGRRKTDGPAIVRNAVVEMPIGRTSNIPDYTDDGIEAGEDFVPEEATALQKARREGTTAIVPVRRRQPGGTPPILQFLATFGAVVAISSGVLWTNEKFAVGYCGIGRDSEKIGGVQIPAWADALRPQCEPCPTHATCYSQLKTECERDFVLRQHPLSLNGVLPLPPTCEADSEKAKRIKAVSDYVTDELRKQKADAECGDAESPKLTEDDLKSRVVARVSKKLTEQEVDALFAQAIDDVASRDEVTTTIEE